MCLYIERERHMNSSQTTLTPNPEKSYKYCSVTRREETCFGICSSNAFKFRCRWFGSCSLFKEGSDYKFTNYMFKTMTTQKEKNYLKS